MNGSEFVIVLTTFPVDGDAGRFASILIDERLAACVNVLPEMESFYRWEGRLQTDRERQIVIKSTAARLSALMRRVREMHPFDVPELLVLPVVDGSDGYLSWMKASTQSANRDEI